MDAVFYLALGYLSGSVLYAYYLPLWLKGMDVTEDTPDGNPGVFNCVAKAGWSVGMAALACDLLKGAIPVFLAVRALGLTRWTLALAIAAPAAGHAWPVFRHFKGGKSITVSFGVMLGLWPVWQPFSLLAACYLLFSLVVRLEPHRFRSMITYTCFGGLTVLWLGVEPVSLGCVLTAVVILIRHCHPEMGESRPEIQHMLGKQR